MTAAERRQAILEVLCLRRHETRENLANEFGVSKRTIEYDVLNLMLTYPVYTVQGNVGGIYVTDNFRLDRPRMNEKQTALLQKVLLTLSGEDKETMQNIINIYGGRKK
ncbi:MAG: hypothetical protein L6V79_02910 [Clostridium sp.]|nr:MAG: hypothetical protein L6V79_02910 [Clostridium sp.]